MYYIMCISILAMFLALIWGIVIFVKEKDLQDRLNWRTYKHQIIILGIGFIVVILSALFSSKKDESKFLDGYIITEGKQTNQTESLFYYVENKYMINLQKMDDLLNIDVIQNPNSEGYIIRSAKNQMEIVPNDQNYIVNLNTVKEDDSYLIPFIYKDEIYADTDKVFAVFGYQTDYQSNHNNEVVELLLTKTDGDPYETITLKGKPDITNKEPEKQVEEGAVNQSPDIQQPGNNRLPTIPYPNKATPSQTDTEKSNIEFNGNDSLHNTESTVSKELEELPYQPPVVPEEPETYPEDIQEIINNRPVKRPKEPQIIARPEKSPNKKTDEEFEQLWEESKNNIKDVFQSGNASTGNVPYYERTEDCIVFNPMKNAIYYDTITVLSNTTDEDVFMQVHISPEWSDMALNTDNAESKVFYECIPRMVEAAIKNTVGAQEGAKLYAFIKEHADKTRNGGYVGTHNEYGDVISVWTDGPVGDGIMSTELDFSTWQGKTTDQGLRYYAARDGEGVVIKVFKN